MNKKQKILLAVVSLMVICVVISILFATNVIALPSSATPAPSQTAAASTQPLTQTTPAVIPTLEAAVAEKTDIWAEWSVGDCDKPCGPGTRTKTRACLTPANGVDCVGDKSMTEDCNNGPCVGGWGEWDAGTTCTAQCGPGTITKKRKCLNPALGCDGVSEKTEACIVRECPIDGVWSDWTTSDCSKPCGGGELTKTRTCKPPQNGGLPCAGSATEKVPCNTQPCPINGVWSDWTSSDCSQPCGGGEITKTRTCKPPQNGGLPCVGPTTEKVPCNMDRCFQQMIISQKTNNIPIDLASVYFYDSRMSPISTAGMDVILSSRYDQTLYPGSNLLDGNDNTFMHTGSSTTTTQSVYINFPAKLKIAFIDVVARPGYEWRAHNLEILLLKHAGYEGGGAETLKMYPEFGQGGVWGFALTPTGKRYWMRLQDMTASGYKEVGNVPIVSLQACENDISCYGVTGTPLPAYMHSLTRDVSLAPKSGHSYWVRSDQVDKVIASLKQCNAAGTFNENCLNALWKSVGCTTNIREAMDSYPGNSWTAQLNWYNGRARDDVLADMRLWAESTGGDRVKACKGR